MIRTIALVSTFALSTASIAAEPVDRNWIDPHFGKSWSLIPAGDEIVVVFEPSAAAPARSELLESRGLAPSRPFSDEYSIGTYRVPTGRDRTAEVLRLQTDPRILGAAPSVVDGEGFTKYYVPGQLTVQFRKDLGDEACRERIASAGSLVLQDYWTPGYYKISVPEGSNLFAEIRAWIVSSDVLFAEPLYMCYDDALVAPNDPFYPQQWHLENPGTGPWLETADVHAEQAWEITRGDPGVLVVVIDTGADLAHEDLVDRLLPRNGADWDFSGGGTVPTDNDGHGTCCSGLAVATQGNGIGVSGICPECSLMPLKIDLGSGQNANRADAINYATSRRPEFSGVVMSCSWRMSSGDFTAVQAAVENVWANDAIILFASGNDDTFDVSYPARYPEAVAVGASSPCDQRKSPSSCDGESWWGSNYGPSQEVVSPGVLMYTTDISGNGGYSSGQYMPTFNGTSSACPLAAGVVGLIYSTNPNLSNAEVRGILQASADDQVGPPSEDTPGWDIYFGYGRVNAARAVEMARILETFDDDLESGGGAWTTAAVTPGSQDRWHLSDRRNHTEGGQFSYRCGAVGPMPYPSRIDAALLTPPVQLNEPAVLTFWHWMDAETVDESTAKDGGLLEITTDGGSSWTSLTPVGGYTHLFGNYPGEPFPVGTPLYSGEFDWADGLVNLLPYVGGTIQIRFRFGTRNLVAPGEGGEGWYVDDVAIGPADPASVPEGSDSAGPDGAVAAVRLRLHPVAPNPARGHATVRFDLAAAAPVVLELFDIAGRRQAVRDLGMREAGAHEIDLETRDADGRTLPQGTYFYRVTAGKAQATRSVVVLE